MVSDGGSSSKTSMPAARTWPDKRASASASSSIIPPRAVLTTMAPRFISDRALRSIKPRVSDVSGTWIVSTSATLSTLLNSSDLQAQFFLPFFRKLRHRIIVCAIAPKPSESLRDCLCNASHADVADRLAEQFAGDAAECIDMPLSQRAVRCPQKQSVWLQRASSAL